MDSIRLALVLLAVTALAGIVGRLIERIPLPLVQILVGALFALPADGLDVPLEPDVFLLLFIPPLLFAEGRRIPKREFADRGVAIAGLALGLVAATVLAIGLLAHWLMPQLPLPVCFALGAVLSPTDAVALSAVCRRFPLPSPIQHVLDGEALMNDASGLVALRFAIAAALTGRFSWAAAGADFVWVAAGGIGIGLALAWLYRSIRARLLDPEAREPAHEDVLLMLLLPFGAYMAAEALHVSGILAAVAAGMSIERPASNDAHHSVTRIQTAAVWSMIDFVFNGVIFVLLGLQLPKILAQAGAVAGTVGIGAPMLLAYAAAITAILYALRFAWVLVGHHVSSLQRRQEADEAPLPGLRWRFVATFAGIRGAITLAGVLSIPLAGAGGQPFPGRDVVVLLAATVMLATLLFGAIAMPLLLAGNTKVVAQDPERAEERDARVRTADAAIRAVEAHAGPQDGDAEPSSEGGDSDALLSQYRRRIDAINEKHSPRTPAREDLRLAHELRMKALAAEREELARMRGAHEINDATWRRLVNEIDLAEVSLGAKDKARWLAR